MLLLTACGKDKPAAPAKATLVLPEKDQVCTSGVVQSDFLSKITFKWNASANTTTYDLAIKNLATSATIHYTSASTQLGVVLPRKAAYSWFITSQSNKTSLTGQSDTWNFYSPGKGDVSYAPVAATLTAPKLGDILLSSTTSVNLQWTGYAGSGTITGFDIYFGEATAPPLLSGGVTNSFLNNVTVASGKTYYWRVVTKNSLNNTSSSQVYFFQVQ